MKKHDKQTTYAIAASLLAVLCCALPVLVPAVLGLKILSEFTLPWLVGASALLCALLLAGKKWRSLPHKMNSSFERASLNKILAIILIFTALGQSGHTLAANEDVREKLSVLANSEERPAALRARNQYRHPVETLMFFGLQPGQTVVEIWPGGQGGWYRSIIEPFLAPNGHYLPVPFNSDFPDSLAGVPAASADLVLVFRAHGFLIYDPPEAEYFQAIYQMVKPGGIFGIVDHRELESREQDPEAVNGYVKQSYVIELAESAGFELLGTSEINANPRDTKDYPEGLYSLPPSLRNTESDPALRDKVLAIGESDRMTLKFRKPGG